MEHTLDRVQAREREGAEKGGMERERWGWEGGGGWEGRKEGWAEGETGHCDWDKASGESATFPTRQKPGGVLEMTCCFL